MASVLSPPASGHPDGDSPSGRQLRQRAPRWVTFGEARELLRGKSAVVLDPDVEASGRIFISLGHAGASVRLARRFALGLRLLEEVKPQLLIAAARVPDGDVLQLFTRLKGGGAGRPLLVALGTGNNRVERRRCHSAGCDAYLAKPVDVRLFAQELARELTPGAPAPAGST
jgi:DNA-binding response OmpR family regulator